MAITSWPYNSVDTTEAQFEQWARSFTDSGADGTPAGTELKPYGDGSGMNVKVGAGFGVVSGTAFNSSAIETLTIGAASAFLRHDLIVARRSLSANTVVLAVVPGVSASTDPAITQTLGGVWEEVLGRVTVQTSSTSVTAPMVTDLRRFLAEPVGKWTTTKRPTSPKIGKIGWNFTLGRIEYWDGTDWRIDGYNANDITAGTLSRPTSGDHTGLIKGKGFDIQQTTPTPIAVGHVWIGW